MVLVGLGILVASFTFFVLARSPPRWQRLIDRWRGREIEPAREHGEEILRTHSVDKKTTSIGGILAEDIVADAQRSEDASPATTPKARPQHPQARDVFPSIALDSGDENMGDRHTRAKGSSKRIVPQPQRSVTLSKDTNPEPTSSPATSLPAARPLPKPKTARNAPSTLLMPPPLRPSALRPLPKTANPLNPPPSAASSLRIPPSSLSAPKTSSLPATASILPAAKRPSRKVILTPGHSPLDWAHLTSNPPTPTFLRGAQLPQHLIRITPSLLRKHDGRKGRDAWSTWQGKVYNVTPYLEFHPGGKGELMRGAGKMGEAERLFGEVHPWVNWEGILGECLVGIMVGDGDEAGSKGQGELDLEEMD